MITRRTSVAALVGLVAPLGAAAARGDNQDKPKKLDSRPDDGAARELSRIEHDWAAAVVHPNRTAVQRMISEDFSVVDSTGHAWTRDDYLEAVASGAAGIESLKIDDLAIRVFGAVAVVTGRLVYRAGLGRSDLNGQYRYTKTYLRRDGEWRCIAAQEGRIIG